MADVEIITNISGLDELEETLVAGGKKAAQRFLRSVEKKAAQPVLEAMQETVPIDTGDLLVSLAVRSKTYADGMEVQIGPTSDENYIGRFSNWGTKEVSGIDKNGKKFHHAATPATHWADRAWAQSKEAALDGFIQAATESLTEMSK